MVELSTSHALFSWAGLFIALACCCGRSLAVGENYVGIGYNLLTGNPDGGTAAMGGVDPGLLITRRILDLSDVRALQAQRRHSCGLEQTLTTFYGAKSYQDKLSVGVSLKGGAIAGLANVMFSLSPRFQQMKSETNEQHQVFQDDQRVCNLGHVRFAYELSDWLNVTVTDSFASAVCQLPATYSQKPYMDFLDEWGTHMTEEVDIGTKVIHRSQTTLTEFVQHVARTSGADVSVGGTYMGFGASIGVNFEKFRSQDSYNQSFGSHHVTLEVGSDDQPEPISVQLVSIDFALQSRYWSHGISTFAAHGLCDVNLRTDVIASNLRQALTEYGAYKLAQPPNDPALVIPLTWPRGTYGLMKPISGCPGGRVTWYEGFRYQDTRDVFTENVMSSRLHLAGVWPSSGNFRMDFCIKGDNQISEFDSDWPAGDYCLLKYGDCAAGFQSGWLLWDDEDISNNNAKGGTLPDGVYDDNTKIEFCCRNDGLPTHSIYLPFERPFYLLRHSRGCQHVHNMTLTEEYVYWDEDSFFGFSAEERAGGAHPMDDGNGKNHRIHFCYYYPDIHGHISGPIVG